MKKHFLTDGGKFLSLSHPCVLVLVHSDCLLSPCGTHEDFVVGRMNIVSTLECMGLMGFSVFVVESVWYGMEIDLGLCLCCFVAA